MNAVIIEDETAAVGSLKAILSQNTMMPVEVVAELESIEESVTYFHNYPQPDIIFMDIHLADGSAFKIFEQVEIAAPVIFTTAYDEYALQAFQVSSIDYLLKPISYVDFLQAANKALQWFELVQKPEEIDSIFVKSDYKLVQVDLKKIMYIEGLKDYIKIYTEDDAKPILSLMSMKAMEELLPSSRFIRVHRSFIVQKDKIRVIDRGRIVFDKTYIPISDSYKQVFQAFLDERS